MPEATAIDAGVAGAMVRESKAKAIESASTGKAVRLKLWRGSSATQGEWSEYEVPLDTGMVVLDAVHRVQATQQPDLACRWNCKAGKCGSCSAEVNGVPRLMCMTRLSDYQEGETIQVAPLKAFPVVKDLVTDVKWNFRQNERIQPFTPRAMTAEEKAKGEFNMSQRDVDRVQEFRKCIECFLCQDVCHVLRTHRLHEEFQGPRFMVRIASLEMHPVDAADRSKATWKEGGIGLCNITKCCTEVCPEHITITDNAIIPLKERQVSRHDPVAVAWRGVKRLVGLGQKLPMAK
jgi:succinate dehydrogenase / fumarate reductase, iron-sulfur subunit